MTDTTTTEETDTTPQVAEELDTERALLASMLRDPKTGGQQLFDQMQAARKQALRSLSPADFYLPEHGLIWQAMQEMFNEGSEPTDLALVATKLKRTGKLDAAGGCHYLAQIFQSHFTPIAISHYVDSLRKTQSMRMLQSAAETVISRTTGVWVAHDLPERVGGWMMTQAERAKLHAAGLHDDMTVTDATAALQTAMRDTGKTLLPTRIADLDEHITGLGAGEMIVIGGRPSMGKSCLVKQIALEASMDGTGVGIIAVEESPQKIVRNFVSNLANIENHRLRKGEKLLNDGERGRMQSAIDLIAGLNLRFATCRDIGSVVSQIHRWVDQYGLQMIIVDYLQRITTSDRTDYERVSRVSREVSDAIKDTGVCGLITAQLSRASTIRDDKRPTMEDLRSSGQIEQDADGIVLIHRADAYRPHTDHDHKTELFIEKWRDGDRKKTVLLKDELQYQRFTRWDGDIPSPMAIEEAYRGRKVSTY